MSEDIDRFLETLIASLKNGSFVKLSLGNYKGTETQLQKILVRPVTTKKGSRLYFVYRETQRDTAKNFDLDTGVGLVSEALDNGFRSGHLFTTEHDYQLTIAKTGNSRMTKAPPTFTQPPPSEHDREKKAQISPDSFYLRELGITDDSGRVRDRSQDKWRQINKFVEILAGLVENSSLKENPDLKIVDMGSGKGYLTFAAYDYFANVNGRNVSVIGVDTNTKLVELCNSIAKASDFAGLDFVVGNINDHAISDADIVIALHACDTATDDALFKAITAKAELIVAAPCCHQEVRPQITPPPLFQNILKHGVMLERTAETLTDGLRSLLLEREGYSTKLFEFISTEHTPKNNMLVGIRLAWPSNQDELNAQIAEIKSLYGISQQRLEALLNSKDER